MQSGPPVMDVRKHCVPTYEYQQTNQPPHMGSRFHYTATYLIGVGSVLTGWSCLRRVGPIFTQQHNELLGHKCM